MNVIASPYEIGIIFIEKEETFVKKALALVLTLCVLLTMASFPATAAATNTKRVKIFTMGDSFTAGICEPNAYRYYIYENLIKDGGVFEFIGPVSSSDYRVTDLYNKHGGNGGAVIGYKDDVKWNGSSWATNAWTVTTNKGITMKYNGTKNSIYYRLFAGSDADTTKNVITFVYKKLTEVTYVVRYVDKNGNPLADEKTCSTYVGHGVLETAVAISGYKADETTKTLVLTEGENVITFTYTSTEGAGYLRGVVTSTDINAENVRYIKIEILDWKYRPTIREITATVIPAN